MATYFMDRNGSGTAGFGTLGGSTWNTSLVYWTNSPTGGSATLFAWNNTTNAADVASFGNTGATATGGEITVSGTVNAGGLQALNLTGTTYIAYNTGTIAFGSNAATINNDVDMYVNDTCTLTGTGGFTKTGAAALYLRGTATNFASLSGAIAHNTANSTIGLQIFANNAVYFGSSTTVALAANTFLRVQPIFSDRTNATVNGAFSGTGRVSLENTASLSVGTVTFPGTLVGLTGYSASAHQGLYLYAKGAKAVTKDLPAQLTYVGNFVNYGVTATCDVNCTAGTAPTYSTKISAFNDGAFDSDFYLRSIGSQSFTITGGIHRDNTSKTGNTIAFVLGGTNTGDNTLAGDSSKLPAAAAWNLQKSEAGTWVFTGSNAAFENVYLNSGTLKARNSNALGQSFGQVFSASTPTLEIAPNPSTGNINIATPVSIWRVVRNTSGENTLSGTVTVPGTLTIGCTAGVLSFTSTSAWVGSSTAITLGESGDAGNISISGQLTSTSLNALTKNGAGVATLTNASNTFTANPEINAGVLAISSAGALGAGSGLTLVGSSVLRYTGALGGTISRTVTASSITGGFENAGNSSFVVAGSGTLSGTVTLGGTGTGKYNTLAIPVAAGSSLFNKQGPGRWISTGGNNLTGATSVSAGTLMCANANGATGTKLLGGNVTVAAGAKIQTGSDNAQQGKNRYSSLTFNGTSGTPARIRIGGSAVNPTIQVSGVLTIPAGGMTWDISTDTFKSKGVHTLVEFGPSGSLSGSLSNVTLTKPLGFESRTYVLDYNSGVSPKTITVTIS